jgi:sulfate adenylyltransferase
VNTKESLNMSRLVPPHGGQQLNPRLLSGEALAAETNRAGSLTRVPMTSRETSDLIMLGIGAFSPLDGFMGRDDWQAVCERLQMPSRDDLFWPIPITLSVTVELSESIQIGDDIALWGPGQDGLMGTMTVREKYTIDKAFECRQVFGSMDNEHPGVAKTMAQAGVNIAGPVKVLSEADYPSAFAGIYQRPADARRIFEERGWSTVAALQLRNPMLSSHAYLAKIAIEVCDGCYVHQLIGKLKPGDIPADVRVRATQALVDGYFRRDRVVQGGYPLEMRYAGPREALLHAVFRQNFGCSHLIVGRDHAGVGDYYGPFDAQHIFSTLPAGSLQIVALTMDWTFYCYECGAMASMKTCPHEGKASFDDAGNYREGARLLLSGTLLRKLLSENRSVPSEFAAPEVISVLKAYYDGLEEKVAIKLHGAARGDSIT